MTLLEMLSKNIQARVVPETVQRIIDGQVGIVRTLLEFALDGTILSGTITVYRKPEAAPGRMPSYGFITNNIFQSPKMIPSERLDLFHRLLEQRYGARAAGEVLPYPHLLHTAYSLSWGLWLDEDLLEKFSSQELPTFTRNDFTTFVKVPVNLMEPLFAYDLDLLKEKAEACGAALCIEAISEKALWITLPSLDASLDEERWDYLMRLLQGWQPEAQVDGPADVQFLTADEVRALSEVKRPAAKGFALQKVEASVRLSRLCGCTKAYTAPGRGITKSLCESLFGPPTTYLDPQGPSWEYHFQIHDALAVIEGAGDNAIRVYMLPGESPAARAFEKFLTLLKG